MLFLSTAWAYERRLPPETEILGFQSSVLLVTSGTGSDTVYSSTPQCGSEEPALVPRYYTGAFCYTSRPKGPECGSRSGTWLKGRDF